MKTKMTFDHYQVYKALREMFSLNKVIQFIKYDEDDNCFAMLKGTSKNIKSLKTFFKDVYSSKDKADVVITDAEDDNDGVIVKISSDMTKVKLVVDIAMADNVKIPLVLAKNMVD